MWMNCVNVPCTACKGTGEMEVNNEQYIRLCPTKELAVMLVTYALYPMDFKPYKDYLKKCSDGLTEKDFVDMTIKWLKEKHDES